MAKRNSEGYWVESLERWQCNVTNDDGERKTFTSKTPGKKGKLTVERKADEWLESGAKNGSIRVETAFDNFIEHIQGQGTSKTYWRPYISIGNAWIKPYIGTKRMSSITERELESILQKARNKGLAKKSIKNIRSCITAFLKYARKAKLTNLHPEELTMPKGAKESEKFTLTEDEVRVLMASDKTTYRGNVVAEWYIHAFRFSVLMGYRPGEIAGFQTSDIKDNLITTVRGVSEYDDITDLKNKNAKRTKMINALAMKELEAQRLMLKQHRIISPWLFPQPDGRKINHDKYRVALRRYFAYNNIGRRTLKDGSERYLTPYEFRHTWVSANDELPDGLKKRTIGWSETFSGDNYNHKMESDDAKVASFEEAKFNSILNKK